MEYGPRIRSLEECFTDRRSEGSDPGSFGITWIISWLTKAIIRPGMGYFTGVWPAWKWSRVHVLPHKFSLVPSPVICLGLIFESCLNVKNQEGISRTLMYWQSLEKSIQEQTEVIFHKISISPRYQHLNNNNNTSVFKLELGSRHALDDGISQTSLKWDFRSKTFLYFSSD